MFNKASFIVSQRHIQQPNATHNKIKEVTEDKFSQAILFYEHKVYL